MENQLDWLVNREEILDLTFFCDFQNYRQVKYILSITSVSIVLSWMETIQYFSRESYKITKDTNIQVSIRIRISRILEIRTLNLKINSKFQRIKRLFIKQLLKFKQFLIEDTIGTFILY